MVAKCANTQIADRAVGQQPPQPDRERLVVIVLADQDDAPGAVSGFERRAIAVHASETPASPRARVCPPQAPAA